MESIKKLEQAAKDCLKDLRTMESQVSIAEGNLAGLRANKDILTKEVTELGEKKMALIEFIGRAGLESQKELEAKNREIKTKEDALEALKYDLRAKIAQAEGARKDAEHAKFQSDAAKAQYDEQINALNEKARAVAEIYK